MISNSLLEEEQNSYVILSDLANSFSHIINRYITKRINQKIDLIYKKVAEETEKKGMYTQKKSELICYVEEKIIYYINSLLYNFTVSKDSSKEKNKIIDLTYVEVLSLIGLDILSKYSSKDGVIKMDIEIIQTVYDMLCDALENTDSANYIVESAENRKFRDLAKNTSSLLKQQLEASKIPEKKPVSWAEKNPSKKSPTLTLPDPETDRGTYELWKDRADKSEKPLDFLIRNWSGYIEAGVMGQSNLRGSTKKTGLDVTLYNECKKQCFNENIDLNEFLPSKSRLLDVKINSNNLNTSDEIIKAGATLRRRNQRCANLV